MNNHLKTILSLILISSLLLAMAGCSGFSTKNKTDPSNDRKGDVKSYEAVLSPKEIKPFSDEFTSGINRYGFDVLLDLYDGENIAVSPASLELALLMTAMGATGKTKEEMIDALRMTGLPDEEIRSSAAQLMWRANNNGMEAANSLWLLKDFGFSGDFLNICNGDFMADLYEVDYRNDHEGAIEVINAWANDKTHGKIPKIINNEISNETKFVIVNALYFLGEWETAFRKDLTYDEVFHGVKGDAEVPFMHATREVRYYEGRTFQLIILPFRGDEGQSGPFAMSFILPKEGSSPEEAAAELSETGFETAVGLSSKTEVIISLPKFEFDYGTLMNDTMWTLGMKDAFTDTSMFDLILESGEPRLKITNIIHKTYIRIDEEGAEAAAVTAMVMDALAMPNEEPEKIIVFDADRPFLFAIYDTTDGTVLFTGVTANLE